MKTLVAGGAGFLGSNLVDRLLAEGHQVDVVDDLSTGSLANLADARRSRDGRFTFNQLDVRASSVGDLMMRLRPDVVFHLVTAPPQVEVVAGAEVAVTGGLRLLEGARRCGAHKLVYACSGAVYGHPDPGDLPLREGHSQRPVTLAGVGEKATLDYLYAYRETHNLEYTALVLGHVYGPRQPVGPVVSTFAARLVRGEECVIYGTGGVTRDFVYVDDAVDALARAAERGGGLVVNIGTGRETAVRDLYRAMAAAAGVEAAALRGPGRPEEVRRFCLDPGRASIHLGWKAFTSLGDGTATLIDWHRSRG